VFQLALKVNPADTLQQAAHPLLFKASRVVPEGLAMMKMMAKMKAKMKVMTDE
jgi:hypothetical protein